MSNSEMRFKKLMNSLKKRHYLYPVKEEQPTGKYKYYVLLSSRGRNGKLHKIYFPVDNEKHAIQVIKKFTAAIKATSEDCIVYPLRHEFRYRFTDKPKKIEAGFYEYRGYEIMDMYEPGFTSIDRWNAREKPWLDGNLFGSFNTLRDAMLVIDQYLDGEKP